MKCLNWCMKVKRVGRGLYHLIALYKKKLFSESLVYAKHKLFTSFHKHLLVLVYCYYNQLKWPMVTILCAKTMTLAVLSLYTGPVQVQIEVPYLIRGLCYRVVSLALNG